MTGAAVPRGGENETFSGEAALPTGEPTLRVGEVLDLARAAITSAFPDEVWISGEIRNLNRSQRGHVYFSLVEPETSEELNRSVSLKVTLFEWYRKNVNHILTRAHGQIRMADGVQVRIRGKVDLYTARGELSVRMTSVDPNFTIGVLELARTAVLQRLSAEGLLESNRRAPLSEVPLRVALVTSAGSAAAADFCRELSDSEFGFRVALFDSPVQGPEAPGRLATALGLAAESRSDVVVIARGGGARTDLATFDDEGLARAIASMPVPVITGIGHETDASIADAVAYRAVKTPTAAAQFLVNRVGESERTLERTAATVFDLASRSIASGEATVRACTLHLDALTRRSEARVRHQIELALQALRARSAAAVNPGHLEPLATRLLAISGRLDRAERDLDHWAAMAQLHDPRLLAARGYSLVRTAEGALVRSIAQAKIGSAVQIHVGDGTIDAAVTATTPQNPPLPRTDHRAPDFGARGPSGPPPKAT
jgi:exodeoxyribonuclease VII large subunit